MILRLLLISIFGISCLKKSNNRVANSSNDDATLAHYENAEIKSQSSTSTTFKFQGLGKPELAEFKIGNKQTFFIAGVFPESELTVSTVSQLGLVSASKVKLDIYWAPTKATPDQTVRYGLGIEGERPTLSTQEKFKILIGQIISIYLERKNPSGPFLIPLPPESTSPLAQCPKQGRCSCIQKDGACTFNFNAVANGKAGSSHALNTDGRSCEAACYSFLHAHLQIEEVDGPAYESLLAAQRCGAIPGSSSINLSPRDYFDFCDFEGGKSEEAKQEDQAKTPEEHCAPELEVKVNIFNCQFETKCCAPNDEICKKSGLPSDGTTPENSKISKNKCSFAGDYPNYSCLYTDDKGTAVELSGKNHNYLDSSECFQKCAEKAGNTNFAWLTYGGCTESKREVEATAKPTPTPKK